MSFAKLRSKVKQTVFLAYRYPTQARNEFENFLSRKEEILADTVWIWISSFEDDFRWFQV